ncbi:hypothetical protein DFH09DRAFT_1114969 [Mycena vulgaris]|nr:hypothetical protein DFH09DRAFT_1114969 [Mycena vulgaris]
MIIGGWFKPRWFKPGHRWRRCGLNLNHAVAGSWILDIGICGLDLPSLTGKAAVKAYDKVKTDAFAAKAFQHTPGPNDATDEARVTTFVANWKQAQKDKKKKKKKADSVESDSDESDQEKDDDARGALLRAYPKAGWRLAIQKVLSNKRYAGKHQQDDTVVDEKATPDPSAAAMMKLIGIACATGRDKFRDDREDEINDLAKTLTGGNAGGKFRKAKAVLWQRQELVPGGVKHIVNHLHSTGRFHPMVMTMCMARLGEDRQMHLDWTEAIPQDITFPHLFKQKNPKLVQDTLDAMYIWAQTPLKEHAVTRDAVVKGAPPVFPLTTEVLEETVPKVTAETVGSFLVEAYDHAFGTQEIEWAAIATKPTDYYDTTIFECTFAVTGLLGFKQPQWYEVATALASGAGVGTSLAMGLVRQVVLICNKLDVNMGVRLIKGHWKEKLEIKAIAIGGLIGGRTYKGVVVLIAQASWRSGVAAGPKPITWGCGALNLNQTYYGGLRTLLTEPTRGECKQRWLKQEVLVIGGTSIKIIPGQTPLAPSRPTSPPPNPSPPSSPLPNPLALSRPSSPPPNPLPPSRPTSPPPNPLRPSSPLHNPLPPSRPPSPPPNLNAKGSKGGKKAAPKKQVTEKESAPPPRGCKRKADTQPVPEDDSAEQAEGRRTKRVRRLPEEAKLEREQMISTTVKAGAKPSYEYVEKSPVKCSKKRPSVDLKLWARRS